jgi:hypothetical protein
VLQPRLECELHPETSPPHLLVRARVRLGADHWVKGFEFSPDLRQWTPPASAPVLISRRTEDGDEWLTWQFDLPATPPGRLFLHMTVTPR